MDEQQKAELIQFLKDNLTIHLEDDNDWLSVEVMLGGELIAKSDYVRIYKDVT